MVAIWVPSERVELFCVGMVSRGAVRISGDNVGLCRFGNAATVACC